MTHFSDTPHIVVMKQHGALNCEAKYYGPFPTFDEAYEAMCDGRIPSLFTSEFCEDCNLPRDGYRFLQELEPVKGLVARAAQ